MPPASDDRQKVTTTPASEQQLRAALEREVAERNQANEQGQVDRVADVAEDVTGRKLAEEALQRANEELESCVRRRTAELEESNKQLRREVLERQKAEQAARETADKLQTVLENVAEYILTVDRDGTLRFINRTAPGITREEVVGTSIFQDRFLPPDAQQTVRAALAKVYDEDQVQEYEIPGLGPHGTTAWYNCRIVPIKREGRVVSATFVAVDITARRQAEEARRESEEQYHALRDQLAHVARLSTMGEMALGLAHELSQPLTAIAGYAYAGQQMLGQKTAPETCRLDDVLDSMLSQAMRAGAIIHRLRVFVRKTTPLRSACNLNELIHEVIALVEPDARLKQIRIVRNLDSTTSPVLVDRVQIQQVLLNLLRNAMDAMKDTAADRRQVTVTSTPIGDGTIEVDVSDFGQGLGTDEADQVFDAFFTTKPKGMGMGLAISRSIIEAHQGRLWTTPNPEGGAVFHFTVPAAAGGSSN